MTDPSLPLDELIRLAAHSQDGAGQIGFANYMDDFKARCIAAKAVTDAIMDWEWEEGRRCGLSTEQIAAAVEKVMDFGFDMRDARAAMRADEEAAIEGRREWA